MNKFYTLLVAAILMIGCGSVSAKNLSTLKHQLRQTTKVDGIKRQMPKHVDAKKIKTPVVKTVNVKSRSENQPITEVPDGETITYLRSAYAFFPDWFSIVLIEVSGQVTTMTFCDNGDVYLKNASTMMMVEEDTYIKGHKDGNKIIFELPQLLVLDSFYDEEEDEYYEFAYNLMMFDYDEEEQWYIESADQTLSFTIADNGTITMDGDNTGDHVMGVFDDDYESWAEYADFNYVLTPFVAPETVTPPASAKIENYSFKSDPDFGTPTTIAFDGSDVYIAGLYPYMPEAWIKGTLADNKITVSSPQFIGVDEDMRQTIYIVAATFEQVYDEDLDEYFNEYTIADKFVFNFDPETKNLTSEPHTALAVNGVPDRLYYLETFDEPAFKWSNPDAPVAAPANPNDLSFSDYFDDHGYSVFQFDLPTFDVNGNYINPDKMHYNILSDDDFVESFSTDDYDFLEEDITDIPYFFDDNYDFEVTNATHLVYIYFTGIDRIGVQSVYTTDAGEELKSEIVYLNLVEDPSGIASVSTAKEVKSVEFFDLAGRRINNPAAGLYIKKVNFTDGTSAAAKVSKK